MTRTSELRDLPDEELLERLESFKEEMFNLRFQLATSQLDNPMRVKQVRHDVARILTVLRERHLERELEEEVARADQAALERSREAQARGEKRGEPLEVMEEAALAGEAEEPVAEEEA
ncbi:MAG: 50S ribosomal protein L29 [Actinobacteria bacterium]|nr:50S ribosomal protein L29 [Actinomycetota bacterium]